MTSFNSTNELRNINIQKIIQNPNYKTRRNPMHANFIDDVKDVFQTFIFENKNYLCNSHLVDLLFYLYSHLNNL